MILICRRIRFHCPILHATDVLFEPGYLLLWWEHVRLYMHLHLSHSSSQYPHPLRSCSVVFTNFRAILSCFVPDHLLYLITKAFCPLTKPSHRTVTHRPL